MFYQVQRLALWSVFFLLWTVRPSDAQDWPMWRYDSGRTAAVSVALPTPLHLQWVRKLPPSQPAWPASQYKLQFDVCHEPVAADGLLFVPSNVSDNITAYDLETGREQWRFYADAPVRFAPVAINGKVWFVSDDSYLYCLNSSDGSLIWKFRGGPSDKKVIGNQRLVSSWPARGGPVLNDGKIYFASSIWPFMGIFYHALDAETGEVLWTNSGSGADWRQQPHGGAISFSNLVPQGYFAVTGNELIVPGGRSTPGVLNLSTGALEHFVWPRVGGGGPVYAKGAYYYNGGSMRSATDGGEIVQKVSPSILTEDQIISVRENNKGISVLFQPPEPFIEKVEKTDRRGEKYIDRIGSLPEPREVLCPDAPSRLFLKAGSQYFFGEESRIACYEIDPTILRNSDSEARQLWSMKIDGTPASMLVADQKLYVITYEGEICCYGSKPKDPVRYPLLNTSKSAQISSKDDNNIRIIDQIGTKEGYCLVLGAGTGQLPEELVQRFQFSVIVLDPDKEKVDTLRRKWTDAGLYGERLSILPKDILSAHLPPYLADLIIVQCLESDQLQSEKFIKSLFHVLRPYGGTACIPVIASESLYREWIEKADLQNANLGWAENTLLLTRSGSLPGSADWTHHYCDSANSLTSKDRLVKAPLGLLWFGGPPNDKILPRHGHGPSPQVVGGRLFIEGPDILRAVDVYTGRLLWEKELKGIGKYYDNTSHQPGAGEIGSNYVSLQDGIYVAYGSAILQLDPATGKTLQTFSLPSEDGNAPNWGYIGAWENLLIATSSPLSINPPKETESEPTPTAVPEENQVVLDMIQGVETNARFAPSSKQLLVMDRKTGEILWTRHAAYSFRHNALVAANGNLYCIDALTPGKLDYLRRRGYTNLSTETLYALNIQTGEEIWKTMDDVFGTWLGYSEEYDVLVQAGSANRDRAQDEAKKGIVVYRGEDGSVVWKNLDLGYFGPLMLHHDQIITNGYRGWAMKLLTGENTGWTWKRTYGCNHAIAGEYLMTFRSGAAGYCDLENESGTGNLGGFKSGCTSNLIAANGVLNAPDYTRTCVCAYQNQSSLAFVHDPEVEMWTFGGTPKQDQWGINFGAPGNRRAPNGTLWLDYPNVGGDPEAAALQLHPEEPLTFRYHATRIEDGDLRWVAASGVKGVTQVVWTLYGAAEEQGNYSVRLTFTEVENLLPGQRYFDISLQGQVVLEDFDILKTAGGMNRSVIKEFSGIVIKDQLTIDLTPESADNSFGSVLCGIEVLREGIN